MFSHAIRFLVSRVMRRIEIPHIARLNIPVNKCQLSKGSAQTIRQREMPLNKAKLSFQHEYFFTLFIFAF